MTRKSIKLPAAIVSAARLFQAKKDHRKHLLGMYLDNKGCVVATNGHVLIKIEHEPLKELKDPLIVQVNGLKLPKKAIELEFVFLDDRCGVVRMYDWLGCVMVDVRSFELIEANYTDYEKALPKDGLIHVDKVGINPHYMDVIAKAQNELGIIYSGVEMEFRGPTSGIQINFRSPEYKAMAVVMPMRL